MRSIKKKYEYVLKSMKKDKNLLPFYNNLNNKTYIVSGASRGVGYNIAKKLAISGANVSVTGKTITEHPKLEGTIFTAAENICDVIQSSRCIGIPCDNRVTNEIEFVMRETLDVFGSIDGVILNASVLSLNGVMIETEKDVNLMTDVNIKGTYMFGKETLKYLKDKNSHMLIIAPPLDIINENDLWLNDFYYTMSKYNMSLMAKYWNESFSNVAVNTLFPRITPDTVPVRNMLGYDEMVNISRTPDIMGDAACSIIHSDPCKCNGNNYIDDEVLLSLDIDIERYI